MKGMNKFKGRLIHHMKGDSQAAEHSANSFPGQPSMGRMSMDETEAGDSGEDMDGSEQRPGDGRNVRHGHRLAHIVADHNNNVWVAWVNGRLDRNNFNGKLEHKKAGHIPTACQN